jgi:hypothetical protein
MASNINPNNIDGTYPVAGQDNNSQGFRDNFTNIKTNFAYAETEITDLQDKVVLKAALTGTTLDNDMTGSAVFNATVSDIGLYRVALGSVSGTVTVDFSQGHFQTLTTNGSISLAFTNFPAAGVAGLVRVQVTVSNTAHTLTLPAAVSLGTTGIQGYSSNIITFAATGTYQFEFSTSDNGTTITICDLNRPLSLYTNPIFLTGSEDLAPSAAASLTKTASYFSTASAETATLAAGSNGQIKTFMMAADSGDMVITVTNAGWKTSGTGTITFNDIGDSCVLQYVNSKWYAIGANGVVFG